MGKSAPVTDPGNENDDPVSTSHATLMHTGGGQVAIDPNAVTHVVEVASDLVRGTKAHTAVSTIGGLTVTVIENIAAVLEALGWA